MTLAQLVLGPIVALTAIGIAIFAIEAIVELVRFFRWLRGKQ